MSTEPNIKAMDIDLKRVPAHVAIIMDGNGRWATARGLDRSAGHVEGVKTVRRITEAASELGVKYLTLYTFSTENWNRPAAEVDALMHLVVTAIEQETPDLIKNNVRLHMIGDSDRIPRHALERLKQCMADTAHCTGLNLVLALSYSARWDIVNAARRLAEEAREGKIDPTAVDDRALASRMSTAFMPDPDLLIRTGGDMRLSNYLLWEAAYAELDFCHTYWPAYTKEEFAQAIARYQKRQRRFGLTEDQISNT